MDSKANSQNKKLILVIGATGAQGLAVIDKLLEPCADGTPSPYAVRALTRDPDSRRAKELVSRGIQCVRGKCTVSSQARASHPDSQRHWSFSGTTGAFDDLQSVARALEGVYGTWVNTDGFTVGEEKEVWAGLRIFELAKQNGAVRHYVWSSLDYAFKASAP